MHGYQIHTCIGYLISDNIILVLFFSQIKPRTLVLDLKCQGLTHTHIHSFEYQQNYNCLTDV